MAQQQHGTLDIPEGEHRLPPTSRQEMDGAVAVVRERADVWMKLPAQDRVDLLDRLIVDTAAVARPWVEAACDAKGIDLDDPRAGEEWHSGPALTLRDLRLLRRSLRDIAEEGLPALPGTPTTRPDGQVVVPVFPTDAYDRLLYPGVTAEAWMQPHVRLDDLDRYRARTYQEPHDSGTCLVLGAGNIASIPAMDVLTKLFIEDRVCVLKMNPVNEYLGPILEEAFAALIEEGFLRLVYGGREEGSYLIHHEGLDEIHMTGSDKTHDAIVFGTGDEGARRRAEGTPLLTKPITSELGNITPVIVVPGPWSGGDLAYHGENIASMLTHNAGFNCVAARVIVTHATWARRRHLLDQVRTALTAAPERVPYYPGARDRFQRFIDAHPEAERFGRDAPGCVPWTLITDLDPDDRDEIAFTTEAFAGVFAEVALDAPRDLPAFIARAVEFCNERLWGTLAATIIVHPRSLKDPDVAAAVDRAVADLRYGTVVFNHWAAAGYALVSSPWGAYPGSDETDIQSGRGMVHNTYLLEDAQKTVVQGPFRARPVPPWFITHRTGHRVLERLTAFEADPSPLKVAGIFGAALRG